MKNKIIFFLSLLSLWLILSWSLSVEEILAGAIFSLITVFLSDKLFGQGAGNINPLKLIWFTIYCLTLLWDVVKSCINAIFRLIHPHLISTPKIIEISTPLRNDTALGLLSGTISLLPGAITVEIDRQNNIFQVCCLAGVTSDCSNAIELSILKYQNLLKKVYA
jgi:multisubunit Na+/H+ antiporter MnhE subunit